MVKSDGVFGDVDQVFPGTFQFRFCGCDPGCLDKFKSFAEKGQSSRAFLETDTEFTQLISSHLNTRQKYHECRYSWGFWSPLSSRNHITKKPWQYLSYRKLRHLNRASKILMLWWTTAAPLHPKTVSLGRQTFAIPWILNHHAYGHWKHRRFERSIDA